MKKSLALVLSLFALMFVACPSETDDPVTPPAPEITYTVTFDKNTTDAHSTDAIPLAVTVPAGTNVGSAMMPKKPTRPGHEFANWYTTKNAATGTGWNANTLVTANITVYAKWEALLPNNYSVNFDKNGGDTEADPAQIVVWSPATTISGNTPYEGNTLPRPPTKAGHLFDGWNTAEDGTGDVFTEGTTVSAHTVVYAQWEAIAAGNVAVIFWDKEGITQLKKLQITQGATVSAGDFPDEHSIPYFEITSWKTTDGTAFTSSTTVNENLDVYINGLVLVGGTPEVVGDTVVHMYPVLAASNASPHGAWNGTKNDDGSFDILGGAIRYPFNTIAGVASVANYDFITIDYVASGVSNLVYKFYDSATDYPIHGGGSISNGTGSITFVLRQTTSGGFALQRYGTNTVPMTIQITKITFTKGSRYTVSFDLGGYEDTEEDEWIDYAGTSTKPSNMEVLLDVPLGSVPAAPVWTGYNFTGWYLDDNPTPVSATTVVTTAFSGATLTAHWIVPKVVAPITVDFTEVSLTPRGGTTLSDQTAAGYTITYGSANNNDYGNAYAYFSLTFPDGVNISDFDKVTFTYQGIAGDINSKNIKLWAGTSTDIGGFVNSEGNDILLGPATAVSGTAAQSITVNIGPRAFALMDLQTVRFAFYIHAGASSGTTAYKISNVVFSQNP